MEYATAEGRLRIYTGRSGKDGTLNIHMEYATEGRLGIYTGASGKDGTLSICKEYATEGRLGRLH